MKGLLGLLVMGAGFYGYAYIETDGEPMAFFEEHNPTKNIEKAQDAADIYGSATDRRLEAEFGENW